MKLRLIALCSTGITALAMTPAIARDVTESVEVPADQAAGNGRSGVSDGEIIVTARRTDERLQDVPLAVSALSGDTLRQSGVTNLETLSSTVPNLNVKQGNAAAGSAVFTIRGQSMSNVLLTVDNAVGVYQDNVNNPRAYGLLGAGLIDIQRVEVLRGPQGTLYGRNTTGGAVGIFSQDPKPDFGLSAQLTAGNFHRAEAIVILNAPVSEEAGFRFVAQRGIRDATAKSVGPRAGIDDPRQDDSSYLRGKFVGQFGPLKVSLTGDYYRNHMGGNASRLTGLFDPTLFDANPANDGTNLGGNAVREVAAELGLNPNDAAALVTARQTLLSYVGKGGFYDLYNGSSLLENNSGGSATLNLDFEVSDSVTLRSISGYRKFQRATELDLDGTPFDLFNGRLTTHDRFLSQEFQILGKMGPVDWVAGLYYSDEKGRERTNQFNLRVTNGNNAIFNRGDVTSRSYAAFVQANVSITDKLRVTGGIRYTKEQKNLVNMNARTSGCQVAPSLLDAPGICAATFKNSFEDPSWIVSADYKLTDDLLFYGKVSRGFRGGGQNLRATGSNLAVYRPFAPETVTEYELGAKTELFDRRLRLNIAAFMDDYKDAQRSVTVLINGLSTTLVTNAAKARIKGVEVESALKVVPGLTLNGSLGYLHPRYSSFVDLTGDRTGEPFPAPDWNFSIGAQIDHQASFGMVRANMTYNWQSDQNLQPQARLRAQNTQPAYGLLNGRIGVELDAIDAEVAIFGTNILNKKYFASFVTLESIGFNTGAVGDPRMFGIQFTKRFGSETR